MQASDVQGTSSYAARAASLVMQVVTFRLEDVLYAVAIKQVQEVILCQNIAKSFQMPDDVIGIYNLRGSIIPIVDLRLRLGLSRTPEGERQVLVCRIHDSTIGFVVDEVLQVMKIPRSEIKPPPATLMASRSQYIVGIVLIGSGLVTIVDLAAEVTAEDRRATDVKE